MTRTDGLSQRQQTVSRQMLHRSKPQALVLALWGVGIGAGRHERTPERTTYRS